ncbi:hypothetical protein ACP70R_025264 [Stipagrostis hirtigluma subsp. patula]
MSSRSETGQGSSAPAGRRTPYGCGAHGQAVAEGLTLYACRADYPGLTSRMAIGVTDAAFRGILAELAAGTRRGYYDDEVFRREDLDVKGDVLTVTDRRLMVIVVRFSLQSCHELFYYLLYDSRAASLSMIPCLPDERCEASHTCMPIVVENGGGGDYELLLLARDLRGEWRRPDHQDVLCACTPDARAASPTSAAGGGIGPWEITRRRFPAEAAGFSFPEVMFSYQGQAFWADLQLGLLHCDLRGPRGGGAVVDFGFIGLPEGFEFAAGVYCKMS